MTRFFIQVRGQRKGPFSTKRLRQMAKLGRFGRHYRVSTDGRSWQPADTYPELFEPDGEAKVRKSQSAAQMTDPATNPGAGAAASTANPVGSGWFYSHQGQQTGPVSLEVLAHCRDTRTLTAEDLVWTMGMTEWKPAREALPNLFAGHGTTTSDVGDSTYGSPAGASHSRAFSYVALSIGSLVVLCGLCLLILHLASATGPTSAPSSFREPPVTLATPREIVSQPSTSTRPATSSSSYSNDVAAIKRAVLANTIVPESAEFCPRFEVLDNERGNKVYVGWYRSKDLLGVYGRDNIVAEVDASDEILQLSIGEI